MQWDLPVALVLAVPVLLLPVALVWYINIGGIVCAVKARAKGKERVAQTATG